VTLANEVDYASRVVHEIIHNLSDDKEILEYCMNVDNEESKDELRDLISLIIDKWEDYKEEYFDRK
jgi:hypothetical protein